MLSKILTRMAGACIRHLAAKPKNLRRIARLMEECALAQGIGMGADVADSGEAAVLRRIAGYHTDTPVLFDVGANVGKYAVLLSEVFSGRSYSLHCFEPAGETFQALTRTLASHDSAHTILNNFALSSAIGESTLYYDKAGSGLASMTKRRLDHFSIDFSESEICKTTTLDDYCEKHGIQHIALLKIDVEGHELDVLKGGKKLLDRGGISFIQFEFGGCNIDTRTFLQDFYYTLPDHVIFRITPGGFCQQLAHYNERDEQFVTTNFLAVHRSIDFHG